MDSQLELHESLASRSVVRFEPDSVVGIRQLAEQKAPVRSER